MAMNQLSSSYHNRSGKALFFQDSYLDDAGEYDANRKYVIGSSIFENLSCTVELSIVGPR